MPEFCSKTLKYINKNKLTITLSIFALISLIALIFTLLYNAKNEARCKRVPKLQLLSTESTIQYYEIDGNYIRYFAKDQDESDYTLKEFSLYGESGVDFIVKEIHDGTEIVELYKCGTIKKIIFHI